MKPVTVAGGNYRIRCMEPGDAPGVVSVVEQVWGKRYPDPCVYNPQQLVQAQTDGRLYSVVAVDSGGRVVAHDALECHEPGPVAETGQAMVLPECRGQRLMLHTRRYVLALATELGLAGVYGTPVTTHSHSQRVYEELGFALMGFYPDYLSGDLVPPGMPPLAEGRRQTLLLYYRALQPPRSRRIHPPSRRGEWVETLYRGAGLPCQIVPAESDSIPEAPSVIAWQCVPIALNGGIRLRCVQPERSSWSGLSKQLKACEKVSFVLAEVPVEMEQASVISRLVEEEGFVWIGIGPDFSRQGDVLLYARFKGTFVASDCVVLNPLARRLLSETEEQVRLIRQRKASTAREPAG
jgi:hypothetical protein